MIDKYDHHDIYTWSLTADLAQFFHLSLDDVWAGRVSAGHVLKLVGQLMFVADSRVRMIELGGDPRFVGWNVQAEIAADRFDQLSYIIAGFSKGSDPSLYSRPGTSREAPEGKLFAPTIADFNVGDFMGVINS